MDQLVVVGASLAGLRAVENARKAGFSGSIVLVGDEFSLPYNRPPLSKEYLTGPTSYVDYFRSIGYLRDDLGIELRLGEPATSIDLREKVIAIGSTDELRYDRVVIATGVAPIGIPRSPAGVYTLRTVEDAKSVRAALDAGARTVIVGAGFIGSEVASAARKRGLEVSIVEAAPVPLARAVGEQVGWICSRLHAANGTRLLCGVTVDRFEGGGGDVIDVHLSDGTSISADLVVVGIGAAPSTAWLADSGLPRHSQDGGLIASSCLEVCESVYAAGDVVHFPNTAFDGEMMRLENWTSAAEQGGVAARNAVGAGPVTHIGSVPYFWSDWYGKRIQFVGRSVADEVKIISSADDPDLLALYRRGDRLVGVATIDRPTQIMKFKRLIARRATWSDALEYANGQQSHSI